MTILFLIFNFFFSFFFCLEIEEILFWAKFRFTFYDSNELENCTGNKYKYSKTVLHLRANEKKKNFIDP